MVRVLRRRGHEVVPLGHDDLDITSLDMVRDKMPGQEVVINCAAYTAVDTAESDWERAVNGVESRNDNNFSGVKLRVPFASRAIT